MRYVLLVNGLWLVPVLIKVMVVNGVNVDIGYPVNHSMKGEFKFELPSASSNQYCSSAFSG